MRIFGLMLVAASTCVAVSWGHANAAMIGPPVLIGTSTSNSVREASGIVGSVAIPDVLWTHNDSGDLARFYAISTTGTLLGLFQLSGASNVDWEDIAIGPKPGGGSYLYLGDIGDNDKVRSTITVYRTLEPTTSTSATIASGQYDTALLQYPGGPRNAESLMVDPLSGDLFIVTKNPGGQIYRAAADVFTQPGQTNVLEFIGNVNVAIGEPSAADISPDGLHILVRNRTTTAYLWERSPGQTIAEAFQGTPIPVTLAPETQGEAIGWAADGSGFYTTSEWSSAGPQPIYFYTFAVPEPSSAALWASGVIALAIWKLRRRSVA